MNAKELFLPDGGSAGIYFCEACRLTAANQEIAEQCCKPYKCKHCGAECQKYWTVCAACSAKEECEKERARFEAAEKVTEWDGWIYSEGHGNDGFAQCVEDLFESAEFEFASEIPEYVWTCEPVQFVCVSFDNIKQEIEENESAYEDFDADDLHGLAKLEKAIDAFNEANADKISYRPNLKRALLVDRTAIAKELELVCTTKSASPWTFSSSPREPLT